MVHTGRCEGDEEDGRICVGLGKRFSAGMGKQKVKIDLLMRLWPLTRFMKRFGDVPLLRQVASLVASPEAFRGSFVPVGEEIEVHPFEAAPEEFLVELIEVAQGITVVNFCPCRKGEGCEKYPREIGCMLLGRGACDLDQDIGRKLSAGEAVRYFEEATGMGLLPMLGHVWLDSAVFGLKQFNRFATMCFCCECCCVLRSGMKRLANVFRRSILRAEGFRLEVTDGCTGCAACAVVCPTENIVIEGGRPVFGDVCFGCGACSKNCPKDALRLVLDSSLAFRRDVIRRILSDVNLT